MNIDFIRGLADYIEARPEQFDMDTWGYREYWTARAHYLNGCGTAACIAGNAHLYQQTLDPVYIPDLEAKLIRDIVDDSRKLFDLPYREAEALFLQPWPRPPIDFQGSINDWPRLHHVSPQVAVQMLRDLADGEAQIAEGWAATYYDLLPEGLTSWLTDPR